MLLYIGCGLHLYFATKHRSDFFKWL